MILHVYTRLEIDWLPTILDVCSTKNSICTSSSILVILIRNICLVIKYGAETSQSSATNIVKLPLAFVRSGGIATGDGKASYVGSSLYSWSQVSRLITTAYGLGVNPTGVDPSDGYNRWRGFPLRCLYPSNA